MAARKTPSKGGKPDKLMRDALMLALHREAEDSDGVKTKNINIIAAKLVEVAKGGDVTAIKEIADRVDGKVPQGVVGKDEDSPVEMVHRIVREVVRANPEHPDG